MKLRNKIRYPALIAALAAVLLVSGCSGSNSANTQQNTSSVTQTSAASGTAAGSASDMKYEDFSLDIVPEYSGSAYVAINGNVPFFDGDDLDRGDFESYSDLDDLGRCGVAFAKIGQETMPTEKRGDISSVRPTGWQNRAYDGIDGDMLYNRCHLIAHMFTGQDANEKNLITGTRYFNTEGMGTFESLVQDYILETGNHVLYRVTPVFDGDDLVAAGVLMEAESIEDNGDGVLYCAWCYNVQPGITINYLTGENYLAADAAEYGLAQADVQGTGSAYGAGSSDGEQTYILNTKTKKFHYPDCENVADINPKYMEEYTGTRGELIDQGYVACGGCRP